MSKFNQKSTVVLSTNKAGGQAYDQSTKLELASLLLTSFAQDTFYEKVTERYERLAKLIEQEPEFAAKALLFARNEYGMRSITHIGSTLLVKHISGLDWSKNFFNKIVRRPDDMTEIIACYLSVNGYKLKKGKLKLPNSLKKGFSKAFDRFDNYQIGKYRMENKKIKLVDVMNLVRPVPVETNSEALKQLAANTLKSTGTWESELSKTGQISQNEEELGQLKADVWKDLLTSKKLPYFALLRNLRNIIEQAPNYISLACEQLTDQKSIKKSLVLPFRFMTAVEQIAQVIAGKDTRLVVNALNTAIDLSLNNIPNFEGETVVVLDQSASMRGKPIQIGSLFAAAIAKKCNSDVIIFGSRAHYLNVNLSDSTASVASSLYNANQGSTSYQAWIQAMNKPYDRIIILSDQEAWDQQKVSESYLSAYRTKYKCNPYIFNFDLAGNGKMQFPEKKTCSIAGFSDKTLDLMKILEEDKAALVKKIEEVAII